MCVLLVYSATPIIIIHCHFVNRILRVSFVLYFETFVVKLLNFTKKDAKDFNIEGHNGPIESISLTKRN